MNNHCGFLNINKPPDCTSHDVVAALRKSLGIKKIGHSGTLDPFATGVLVIGIGDATRLFEYLPQDKIYIAEIAFGIGTDTDDVTGKIVQSSDSIPKLEEINSKINSFVGKIKQKPPIFSAIKINGKRAYKLARSKKITLENITEKEVEIYSIEVIAFEENKIKLQVHCSGGTYIRSLARDLGKNLNTYAILSCLKRIKVGKSFLIEKSMDLSSINKTNLLNCLIPPSIVLDLKKVFLDPVQIENIFKGRAISVKTNDFTTKHIQMLDNNNELVGIGLVENNCMIRPVKVLVKNGQQ